MFLLKGYPVDLEEHNYPILETCLYGGTEWRIVNNWNLPWEDAVTDSCGSGGVPPLLAMTHPLQVQQAITAFLYKRSSAKSSRY